MEELKKGNEFVYRYLYEMHYNELCAYIFTLSKDRQQAEDIVQNVMFKIWKNKEKLNIKTSVKNYLYKSCYHELIDTFKKNKKELNYIQRVQKETLDIFIEEEDDFVTTQINRVQVEIDKLPPKCKEIFLLNKVQGFKYREVAEQLDISIKTVETQMSKAMSRIKKALEKS
ncbi:RNA polymerase sigma factor [Aquimarina muelleri]|uniref:RNA polymerase sigma factor n=1 Tax=Aquimarina muelleri TaxID=279356 RepID=UPI0021D38329|nr:RNA polymerase sigma-70 factor [Aquimarina muelleri]MCX2763607.1 RNA polymerase sigma-70 factor [Aquimarina muelleri]